MSDLDSFAYWHVTSGDIDPAYPVLSSLGAELCADADELVSFLLLYVAYYDLGSAVWSWTEGWRPGKELSVEQMRRPTGTERRGHRPLPPFSEHIAALGEMHASFGTWERALHPFDRTPQAGWLALQERLQSIKGNGRWAAYKTGELLKVVAGWEVAPTDAGHAFSSGPRRGLVGIYPQLASLRGNDPRTVAILDRYTANLCEDLDLPVEQVETVLCDWHSTVNGHYYVGHDIDLMQTQLARVPKGVAQRILNARAWAFEPMWLGEANDWHGVRKELRGLYRREGVIDWWN